LLKLLDNKVFSSEKKNKEEDDEGGVIDQFLKSSDS